MSDADVSETAVRRRNVFIATLLRVGAYDLTNCVSMSLVWALIGTVDFGVGLAVSALRLLSWSLALRHLCTPVLAWQAAGDDASDEQVLAADHALQRMHGRFVPVYFLGWGVALLLGVVFTRAMGTAVSDAQLFGGVGLLLGGSVMVMVMIGSVFRTAQEGTQEAVGAVLLGRGLDSPRVPRSVVNVEIARILALLLGSVVGLGTLGGFGRAAAIRDTELAQQQRRAELSALRVEGGDRALEGVDLVDLDDLPEGMREAVEAGEAGATVVVFDGHHGLAMAAAPTSAGRWALAMAAPDEELGRIALLLFGLCVLITPPGMYLGWAHGRSLTVPLERFDAAARRVVEAGELSTVTRMMPLRDDEIGRLANTFNSMLGMLQELSGAAQAVANGDLTVELDHPGELHDAFRGMFARLHEMVVRIRETSLELASAAAEIHAFSQQQEEAAEQQSASVQEVSATVTSLAEAAEQISETASGVLDDAEQTLVRTDAMVGKINELSSQAGSIGDLLEVIREVAKRSDLLALNGSLEATRAGEAGRGFALVAAEMRRLAERVTGTVGDVRVRMADIKASGTSTVMATEDSRKLAQSTAEAARTISLVTRQQSLDTEQVSRSVQEVAELVVAAALATTQTRAAAEGLRAHAGELSRLTGEFKVRGETPLDAEHRADQDGGQSREQE